MKKTIFTLSALLGAVSFSLPTVAMDVEKLEKETTNSTTTIQPKSSDSPYPPEIKKIFEEKKNNILSFLKGSYLENPKTDPCRIKDAKSLTEFFNEFEQKKISPLRLELLYLILQQNSHMFSKSSDLEGMTLRINYTFALICGNDDRLQRDNFIFEDERSMGTNTKKEQIKFLETLLSNTCYTESIYLSAYHYFPLTEMDEETAKILGNGVGNSSLKRVILDRVNFRDLPHSLPVFLNEARNNKNLEEVILANVGKLV